MSRTRDGVASERAVESEPVQALRSRLFRYTAFALLLALMVNAIRSAWQETRTTTLVEACGAVLVVGALLLDRKGARETARLLLSATILVTLAGMMLASNGIHDISVAATGSAMLLGAALLERRPFAVYAAAAMLLFGLIAGAELAGYVHNAFSSATDFGTLLALESILAVTAFGSWLLIDTLTRSLRLAREENAAAEIARVELERRTAALAASEARFAAAFQGSPAPTTISRKSDGMIIEANAASLRAFGYEASEMIGHRALDIPTWISAADRERAMALLAKNGSFQDAEFRFRRKSGEIADVLLSMVEMDFGGERVVLTQAQDVTFRKRTEQALQKSEDRFQKIFHSSPDAIVISRMRDGRYFEVNQAWLDAFGYGRDELIGHSALELNVWVDPANRGRFLQQIRERGMVRDYETRLRKKSGAIADVLLSAEVIDLDGEPHLIIPVIDITDRKRAEERIQQLATRDPLTGLPNRLLLSDRLRLGVANAQRRGRMLAVLCIDLDRFKNINDSLGHATGDAFLKEVSTRLSRIVGEGDTLGRLGGDEFLVLLENIVGAEDAGKFARRVQDDFSQPFVVDGRPLRAACSIGVSVYPTDATHPQDLIRNADTAMYAVKDGGRGSYQFYSAEMNARVHERLRFENGLREAIAGRQFALVYQPKVDIASGRVTGLEALLRWHRPDGMVVAPGEFIGVAEETGLIVAIGRWVLQSVCAQIRDWQKAGRNVCPVAINLSPRQFGPALIGEVGEALREAGVAPGLLELEITEGLFMQRPHEASRILLELAEHGTHVTIDDFGTGYSALSYIKQFRVDALKIDRSFVTDLGSAQEDLAIIRAVIEMARGLGIKVIAEGVETAEQLTVLRALGCNEYQGYLFSRPVAADVVEQAYLVQ